VEIRDKMRRERMNNGRSEAFLEMSLSEEDIAQLRLGVKEGNLLDHINQLKYISINAAALSEFVWLAEPLLQIALQT